MNSNKIEKVQGRRLTVVFKINKTLLILEDVYCVVINYQIEKQTQKELLIFDWKTNIFLKKIKLEDLRPLPSEFKKAIKK